MNSAHRIDAPAFDTVWDGLGLDEEDLAAKTRRGGMGGPVGCLLGVGTVLGLLGLFLGVLASAVDGTTGALVIVPSLILMVGCVIFAFRRMSAARSHFGETVVAPLFQQLLDGMTAQDRAGGQELRLQARYELDGRVDRSLLRESGLFFDTRMPQEDVVTGRFGRTEFVLADLKWQSAEDPQRSASGGSAQQSAMSRNRARARIRRDLDTGSMDRDAVEREIDRRLSGSGTSLPFADMIGDAVSAQVTKLEKQAEVLTPSLIVFSADFHKSFTSTTRFQPMKRTRGLEAMDDATAAAQGLQPLALAGLDLPRGVRGWTSDPAEAHYLLSPQLILALTDFSRRAGTDAIGISFAGSRMTVAVGGDTDLFSLDPRNPDIREMSRAIYDDLIRFLSLVEHFDLNTRIWSKR